MNRLALSCLFLITLFASSCTLPASFTSKSTDREGAQDGFRRVKWGTPLEEMKSELTFVGRDEGKQVEWYGKENDDLSLGGATLESIHYVFFEGMFKRVAMVAKGPENYGLLRDYFVESFGEATESTDRSLIWKLDKRMVMFAYNPDNDVSLLILQERPNAL
jgi:hypothetical protein